MVLRSCPRWRAISAIARHLGRDRKTIRAYLNGERVAGVRDAGRSGPVRAVRRLLPRTAGRGPASVGDRRCSTRSSSSATTGRIRRSPASCGPGGCARRASRAARPRAGRSAVIEHPPGEETQWDWLELPDPPDAWGWGSMAHLLVGALAHSGRWRGGAGRVDGPAAPGRRRCDRIAPRLGRADPAVAVRPDGHGLPPRHRAGSPPSFAAVAKHYGVSVAICPPRRGQPQGRGGEGQPHRRATLVAHPGRRASPSSRPRLAGPVLRAARRHPAARRPPTAKATVATVAAARAAARRSPAPFPAVAHRDPDVSRAGAGRLPRQPLLGAARAGRRHGHRAHRLGAAVHRHRHQHAGS